MSERRLWPWLPPLLAGVVAATLAASPVEAAVEACTKTTAIGCDATATDTLSASDVQCYTFTGHADEVVSVTTATAGAGAGNFNPCWRIVGPLGTAVLDNTCRPREARLAQGDGTYVLQVFDNGHDAGGPYDVTLQSVSNTFGGGTACGTPIGCGDTLHGQVDSPGNTDAFTFSALRNDDVSVSVATIGSADGFQACWRLFTPTGAELRASCGETISGLLPESGRYTIVIGDNNHDRSGSYDVNLQPVSPTLNGAPSCQQVVLACTAQFFEGTLTSPADTDSYTFSGQHDEVVTVVTTKLDGTARFNPCWRIVGPSGTPLATFQCGQGQVTLTDPDGAYGIVVLDNGQDGTGTYRIGFGTPACPIPTGPTSTGEICGNCLDDDHNGLIDAEDPACCSQTAGLEGRRVKIAPSVAGVTNGRLRVNAVLARSGFAAANPLRDDVSIQLRNGNGELLCTLISHTFWTRHGRTFRFVDRSGTRASGLTRAIIRIRPSGVVVLKVRSRKLDLTRFNQPELTVTAAVGTRCSSGTMALRPNGNRLVSP